MNWLRSSAALVATWSAFSFCGARSALDVGRADAATDTGVDAGSDAPHHTCLPPANNTLVSGLASGHPISVAIDADYVYWVNIGVGACNTGCATGTASLMRCAICGCNNQPETIVSGLTISLPPPYFGQLAVPADTTAQECYFKLLTTLQGALPSLDTQALEANVGACQTTGCSQPAIFRPPSPTELNRFDDVVQLQFVGSDLIWSGGEAIHRSTLASDTIVATVGPDHTGSVAADPSGIFWTTHDFYDGGSEVDSGIVWYCPYVGDCTPAVFAHTHSDSWVALAIDASNVYWIDGSLSKCARNGCPTGPDVLASTAGSMNPGPARVEGIATDGRNVYWLDGTLASGDLGATSIKYCSTSGCADSPTTLLAGSTYYSVAIDSDFIYASGGDPIANLYDILVIPKP